LRKLVGSDNETIISEKSFSSVNIA